MRTTPNFIDKVIDKTILWLIPRQVTPNQFTAFRLISVPFVIYFLLTDQFVYGTILFIFSALTDAIDGAMARTRNQITEWGRVYDPIADKLLIGSTMIILLINHLNTYLALAIIATDLVIGGVAIYQTKVRGKVINAHITGKLKMILQCVGIAILLISILFSSPLFLLLAELTLLAALIFALTSLIIYKSA